MPNPPSPRGARPRQDTRPRVLAALTPEPSTVAEIAELPGRERTLHAGQALARLEQDGLAVRNGTPQAPRWSAAADPASLNFEPAYEG